MATATTAYLEYDSEILTNYLPGATTATAQEVQSYTINVQCFAGNNLALAHSSALVQSSTPINVHLNGQPVSLSVTPVRYAFDVTGDICIVAPSTGLTTPTYTFSNLQDTKGAIVKMPITTIDPSKKVLQQFQSVKTGDDLKKMPGRSGTTLYAKVTPPPDSDLHNAATAINDLVAAAKGMPDTPLAVKSALDNIALHPLPNSGWPPSTQHVTGPTTFSAVTASTTQISNITTHSAQEVVHLHPQENFSLGGAIKGGLGTIEQKGGSAIGTVKGGIDSATQKGGSAIGAVKGGIEGTLQKAGNGVEHIVRKASDVVGWELNGGKWYYWINLAGKALKILIEKVEDIGHAFDSVWQTIKLGWAELEAWAGYIFDWEGILDTSKSIHSFFTSSLESIAAGIKNKSVNLNGAVSAIAASQKSRPTPPPTTTSAGTANARAKSSLSAQVSQSTPGKWFSHQSKYGGITDISVSGQAPPSAGTGVTSSNQGVFGKIDSELKAIESKLSQLVSNLEAKFNLSSVISIGDVFATIASEVLHDLTDALTHVLLEFLDILSNAFSLIKEAGDAKIDVPILSWIYKKITGDDLTLFGVLSLLVAIPASVFHRMIYKKPYPSGDPTPTKIVQQGLVDPASSSPAHAATPSPAAKPPTSGSMHAFAAQSFNFSGETDGLTSSITGSDTAMASLLLAIGVVQNVLAVADVVDQAKTGGVQQTRDWKSRGKMFALPFLYILDGVGTLVPVTSRPNLPGRPERMACASMRMIGGGFLLAVAVLTTVGEHPVAGFGIGKELSSIMDFGYKTIDTLTTVVCFSLDTAVFCYEVLTVEGYLKDMAATQECASVFGLFAQVCDYSAAVANRANRSEIAVGLLGLKIFCNLERVGWYAIKLSDAFDHNAPPFLSAW